MSDERFQKRSMRRRASVAVALMAALLVPLAPNTLGSMAAADTGDPLPDFYNRFACRAIAVQVDEGNRRPQIVANQGTKPCQDDEESVSAANRSVELPDDVEMLDGLARTDVEPYAMATAEARVGDVTVHIPQVGLLRVKGARANVSATCPGNDAPPVLAGSSRVSSVTLNGEELLRKEVTDPDSRRVLETASGTLYLNWPTVEAGVMTQQALHYDAPDSVPNVTVGEAKGGAEGNPCDTSRPKLSVGDVSVTEGDAGTTEARFTVSLSPPSSVGTVFVSYGTIDGTATAGSDYTAAFATLAFQPGEVAKTVTVRVAPDTVVEADEVFSLKLGGPRGASITDSVATATVVSDDFPVGLFRPLSSKRIFFTDNFGGEAIDLKLTGAGGPDGVPDTGVSGAVLAITVTNASHASFLTVWPKGAEMPTVSSLNWTAGETVANAAQVKVGDGGMVRLYSPHGTASVAVDVVGWFADDTTTAGGGRYTALDPERILDTRGQDVTGDGVPDRPLGTTAMAPLPASLDATCPSPLQFQVNGVGGVPASGVSAVVVNLTVTPKVPGAGEALPPTGSGALVAWPTGEAAPTGSNVPYDLSRETRRTIPTVAVTKVGADGKLNVCNRAAPGTTWPMHAVADVVGWYSTAPIVGDPGVGASFVPLTPARLLDTRAPCVSPRACIITQAIDEGATFTPLGPDSTMDLQVTGRGGVPAGASAVVLNVTVTEPSGYSFLTVWPTPDPAARATGTGLPEVSNLNYVPGQTVPNVVVVKVGDGGKVSLYNKRGTVDVIADVVGWFAA